MTFDKLNKPLIFDGAMGTAIQALNLKDSENPELLNMSNSDEIVSIHLGFLNVGSDIITTNTFGANSLKYKGKVSEIITSAINNAKIAREKYYKKRVAEKKSKKNVFIAQSLGPSGKLMKPKFDLSFDEAYNIYKEQILAGLKAKPDLHIFETFTDIGEIRAAVLAAKENSTLPIIASLTFEKDKRMLLGTDPKTAVLILRDLGISAIGLNCSLGADESIPILKEILEYSNLPVIIQPNSGLPSVENGKTVFKTSIKEYSTAMKKAFDLGASFLGGCCGTTTEHIKALCKLRENFLKEKNNIKKTLIKNVCPFPVAASQTNSVILTNKTKVFGEKINPTGNSLLKTAILNKDYEYILKLALNQVKAGADIININVGLPNIKEEEVLPKVFSFISEKTTFPLMIDSKNKVAIENTVKTYAGKPIINSISGEKKSLQEIFPIVKKYGLSVIVLLLDDNGVPKNVKERLKILDKIIKVGKSYSVDKSRFIVDALALTVSAEQTQVKETLETIKIITEKYGLRTTLGASNISFGLPKRNLINESFLSIATYFGLSTPITDPTNILYMSSLKSAAVLSNVDIGAKDYIDFVNNNEERFENNTNKSISKIETKKTISGGTSSFQKLCKNKSTLEIELINAIKGGLFEESTRLLKNLLKRKKGLTIIDETIIPLLNEIGNLYEKGVIFLPEMLMVSNIVKDLFRIIKNTLTESKNSKTKGVIIIATVRGDIHDIGKNIVKTLLENYNFTVIDLGKDVHEKEIIKAIKKYKAGALFLSALMTTTMVNMEDVIEELKKENLRDKVKVAIGGAVVTKGFAKKIGADYYSDSAINAVKVANEIFNKK